MRFDNHSSSARRYFCLFGSDRATVRLGMSQSKPVKGKLVPNWTSFSVFHSMPSSREILSTSSKE